jgi:hypothetical protein
VLHVGIVLLGVVAGALAGRWWALAGAPAAGLVGVAAASGEGESESIGWGLGVAFAAAAGLALGVLLRRRGPRRVPPAP